MDKSTVERRVKGIQYKVFVSEDSSLGSSFEQERIHVGDYGLTFWVYQNEMCVIREREIPEGCRSRVEMRVSEQFLQDAKAFLIARENLNKHLNKSPL